MSFCVTNCPHLVNHPCSSNRHTSTNNIQLASVDSVTNNSLYPSQRQQGFNTSGIGYFADDFHPSTFDSNPKVVAVPVLPAAASGDRMNIFLHNVVAPSLKVPLPPPGVRLETTMQLAYCKQLLRNHLSPSLAVASITAGLDPSQRASVDAILQDKEEQKKIRELAIRIVEDFVADSLKTSDEIAEAILLGPYQDQEYYHKLLNCLITEFEAAKLLDIDLLQGLVQLVQCSGTDYLQSDDLVRILVEMTVRI
ncbi:hypothetical protein BGX24_008446 [Mortierella sp. AD032]|nr:hypothetical protein BGX24_008446 [Mortierella sp. AD032]